MIHSQPEKEGGKEKAPWAFFAKELSKTSSLDQPLDIFAAWLIKRRVCVGEGEWEWRDGTAILKMIINR